MKKMELAELFQMLDEETVKVNVGKNREPDSEKILQMTLARVRAERRREKHLTWRKYGKYAAACAAAAVVMGTGIFAAAGVDIRQTIQGILGLSEEQVQVQEKVIRGRDFEVRVRDSAFDGNIGWTAFEVKGISEQGKEALENPRLHTFDQLFEKDMMLTVPETYSMVKRAEGDTRYFVLQFSNQMEEGNVIQLESPASGEKLEIVLERNFDTKKVDIRSLSDDMREYESLEYSALGIKVTGRNLKNPYRRQEERRLRFQVRYRNGEEKALEFSGESSQKNGQEQFGVVCTFWKEFDWSKVEAVAVNEMWFELS